MKVMSQNTNNAYDLAIIGLGYESRASALFDKQKNNFNKTIALGYSSHTDKFGYSDLKEKYLDNNVIVYENDDDSIVNTALTLIKNDIITDKKPLNVILDITVFSRSRLSALIYRLLNILPKKSRLTISYELSEFNSAPNELSPIKRVGEVIPELSGDVGDLNLPTSLILGLGYEKGKALGLVNFIDAEHNFFCIPVGKDKRFDEFVHSNNSQLLDETPKKRKIYYQLEQPYNTYLDIRDLILSASEFSKPLLAPLGPKIFAAICVIIAKELNSGIPVWRVSSGHEETPVDRKASGNKLSITVEV